ncbi:EAL domain-containing protein (putative c-di-GMP-specific phosphodiesterase class I) [Halospina denitrificans]|uniref:EAL domain-containing protein (Putative c-di-GMP-specific phosphodiesterase class I) n=1 Tax=Halospina denitrificans TaxID=332522 RepID=A0A4R7K3C2_9GAMM|nr:sensor domain-containing phosphodiesterase [Halospina denitrificans]TDT44473.1 EAL domain-containing protein (putative c-di-GMP-specific phosphodiesterase class I) [Halospina denitrificans]
MSLYEEECLRALRQLNLLDTPPSECFDRITRMATQLFDLPVAAVSLTDEDRQWFKSRVGTDMRELPRHKSPCSGVSATSEVLVIEDFLESDCYRDSPQAQLGLRFYAGAPLVTRDGYTLGTMCVLGYEPRSITDNEIRTLQDLSAMVMAQVELQQALGRVDPATALPNSAQVSDDLADLSRDFPDGECFALLIELLDVVQLNTLTRVMGPGEVDELARMGSQHLQSQMTERDKLYSAGPCQFLFLRQTEDSDTIQQKALQLHDSLQSLNQLETMPAAVQPAIGIVPFVLGQTAAEDVLRLAHSSCQDARHWEKPAATYSRSLDVGCQRRFALLNDMQRALEVSDQLELVFQPRVALASGECVGAEALLRWQHPELGNVSPGELIPLVENTPQARGLTNWVMRTAIRQAAQWHHRGITLPISINVMASNLEEVGFTDELLQHLDSWNLPPSALELELTESALLSSRQRVHKQLKQLEASGIGIAIDDFGTGYSSLSYLMTIPAGAVKIDRAFMNWRKDKEHRKTLLKGIINLARDLGYRTVAEGCTTEEMLQTLRHFGCDEAQSFNLSKPLSPGAFEAWVAGTS